VAGETILVVDDHALNIKLARKVLETPATRCIAPVTQRLHSRS